MPAGCLNLLACLFGESDIVGSFFLPSFSSLMVNRLRVFESGVLVVQSQSHSEEAIVEATHKLASDVASLCPIIYHQSHFHR